MTRTTHVLHIGDARSMAAVSDDSVHLIVTSPPYPMIEMWDAVFSELVPSVSDLLAAERGMDAFEAMHRALDEAWSECRRVLVPGGFACINIGDATRSLGGEFCLYPNHARIVMAFLRLGMTPLPDILWRKPTNAPNKFMGSGMLPAGAYVTYEHEYILVFRKGGKRLFSDAEKEVRGASAFFWEERNLWFSDVWSDLRGTGQRLGSDGLRARSAAFPFELPFRLVSMYSLQGDTILDPFVGTGTTMAAAFAAGRNSVGYDHTEGLRPVVEATMRASIEQGRVRSAERLASHRAFIDARVAAGKVPKHVSACYGFPVITGQERELSLLSPESLDVAPDGTLVGRSVVLDGGPAEPVRSAPPVLGDGVAASGVPLAEQSGSAGLVDQQQQLLFASWVSR